VRKARNIVLAALAATGLSLAIAPAQAGKTKKRTVEVGDYYFAPARMTVKRNTVVVWKWPAGGGDGHDVYLKKGPKGVKRFRSEVLFADTTYRKKLKKRGRYRIICTLHEDSMRQTITVK
jgi:plastocyanin